MRPRTTWLLAVAMACATGGRAAASDPSTSELFAQADMVFEGTVAKISYGLSRAEKEGDRAVPFTLVTFTVESAIAGVPEGRTVRLRFLGGPLPDGKIMFAHELPAFDVGDRDLLFVLGNGVRACPLVGCARGRIRIVRGHAYADDGSELRLEGAELRRGRLHDLEEVRTTTIAGHTLRRVAAPAPHDRAAAAPVATRKEREDPPLGRDRLVAWAAQRAAALRHPGKRAARVLSDGDVVRAVPAPPPGASAQRRGEVAP